METNKRINKYIDKVVTFKIRENTRLNDCKKRIGIVECVTKAPGGLEHLFPMFDIRVTHEMVIPIKFIDKRTVKEVSEEQSVLWKLEHNV